MIAPGRNGVSGQHALMSVGFLECFVQGKKMSIYVVALLALARAETKKIATDLQI